MPSPTKRERLVQAPFSSLRRAGIAEAERAISERAVVLLRTNGREKSEQVTLAGAHSALGDLKRIQLADHRAKNGRVA